MNSNQSIRTSTQQQQKLILPNSLPQDLFNIFKNLVLFFCRRVIFAPPNTKIIIYFCMIFIGSVLKDFNLSPQTYLANKQNLLNSYFAKLGWGSTIMLLSLFVYLTSLIYTKGNYNLIMKHLLRLLIAIGVWYIITSLFQYIESVAGYCKHLKYSKSNRQICLSSGYEWQEAYNLSDHTFLLIYLLLVVNEEVKSYDEGWKRLELLYEQNSGKVKQQQQNIGDISSSTKFDHIDSLRFRKLSLTIKCLYISLALLTMLWEFMLLSTALYFHHIVHKLGAALLAVIMWFITYRYWYKQRSAISNPFTPCLPGDGLLAY
ncbi:unnamed protein product [Didymodactylos carnosus]|uniref:FIT family protein n=1 Tax=Didymodactylos carnosus TaxID=1234261 RepID=A0A813S840_9BILA|nr:unnamed protein product [Didymodactylos carnosus]CAF0791488.1 unnamed protein product [Didymodactylos carnosus]CAF3506210.1 unnamed protein product [Didymodactylos carnosus]CAF3575691.1 unnamed protein product [Didymodactylos carnosus]